MYHILVVEDDNDINSMLKELLINNGYIVTSAFSGSEAILVIESKKIDLMLLDIMLPGLNGNDVLKELRKTYLLPIIALTALDSKENKIEMFENGVDDYIVKPFDVDELLLRIKAVLRRNYQKVEDDILTYKDIKLNRKTYEVTLSDENLTLTKLEFKILELLMSHPKKVFTKNNIFEVVWGSDFMGEDNVVNVHISKLRSKIAKISKDQYIETVWSIGFKMA